MLSAEINIRRASRSDIPRIVELWEALGWLHRKKYGYDNELFRQKKNSVSLYKIFLSKRVRARNVAVFVAEVDGRIIGHVIVSGNTLRPPLFVHGKEAFIDEIFVEESYRRKGIGTKLLEEAEAWAKKRGIFSIGLFVSTKNKGAFSAYRKSGFFEHHMKMSKIIIK